MVRLKKLAKVVNQQTNPNETQRIDWNRVENALTESTNTYAYSSYYKLKYIKSYTTKTSTDKNGKEVTTKIPVYDYKYNHPWTLTAHNFDLNLPSNATVKNVTFQVYMKVDSGISVKAPIGRFCIPSKNASNRYTTTTKQETGWHNGYYEIYPSTKLTTDWKLYSYSMDTQDILNGGFDYHGFNLSDMGIDLRFTEDVVISGSADKIAKHIQVGYVQIVVDYVLTKYQIDITDNIRRTIYTGDTVTFLATFKKYNGTSNVNEQIALKLPDGIVFTGTPVASSGSFNEMTHVWTVPTKIGGTTATLKFQLNTYRSGTNTISMGNTTMGWFDHSYPVERGASDGFDDLYISQSSDAHLNHRFCIDVFTTGFSEEDTTVTYTFTNFYNAGSTEDTSITTGEWCLMDDANHSEGISVNDATSGNVLVLNVPQGDYHAYLRFCFKPTHLGINACTVRTSLDAENGLTFEVGEPYTYHITSTPTETTDTDYYTELQTQSIGIIDHRVLSEVGLESTYIPFTSDPVDANMTQSKGTFGLNYQEEVDYIGCVPLEQTHFEPKSTYKDTLLNNKYKNVRYMGKELASDEDITLNVRLHPHQVTTIQGLIDMDKPIPINTNHKSFEGDSLNHRGWCEIYSIKTSYTNPHWYKCDIDVKYLTHNLNTRFKIDKGIKVGTYNTPSLMSETVQSGSNLSGLDYFDTDTDGTFTYNDDEDVTYYYLDDDGQKVAYSGNEELISALEHQGYVVSESDDHYIQITETLEVPYNQRNVFSIDEGQYITVKSHEPLSNHSVVAFEWLSSRIAEDKENNIRRVIRLIDKSTNQSVFEYEYYDFEFDDDNVTCSTVARAYNDGEWILHDNIDIDLRTDTPISNIDDDELDESELLYGSTLLLNVDNKKVDIIDEGFSSREVEINDLDIESNNYYWETEWVNNNNDGETNDILCYFNINVMDTILTSQYGEKYDKLYVSPFPVKDKKLVFTREAEEGTVYYFEDDGEEFSYLINPYYQYQNGTDLVTSDGISIFSLNYGYELVYIQNGLVRFGFNRLNGKLYIGKFDPISKSYIDTHRFHIKKYDDININSISDDKIEIQASDSIFTIWRGHPYIMIKHNNETIWIDSQFNRVWGEQVGNDVTEYPTHFDLMNDSNLISYFKTSDCTVDTVEVPARADATLEWSSLPSTVTTGVNANFVVDGTVSTQSEALRLDNHYQGVFGDYTVEYTINDTYPKTFELHIPKPVIQSGETDDIQASLRNANGEPINTQTVYFYEVYTPTTITMSSDKSIIQNSDRADITAKLKDEDGSLIKGETVYFYVKED